MGRNQDTLASAPRASVGLHVIALLLGSVFALLAVVPARASVTPSERSGAGSPGFLLDGGRYTTDGGLLLERGVFRPLPDVPGAPQTLHLRNNNRGQIAGTYVDDSDGTPRIRGFLMERGRVTRIDVAGAMATLPVGINDRGQVVGGWIRPDATVDPVTGELLPVHGFLWEGGRFTKFDIPCAITTAPYEINNRGQIVGNYGDAAGAEHGFVLRRGVVTTIDHPGATASPALTGTRVVGIDDRGRLVGSYGDDAGTIRAWKWENGRFTTIHPPRALLSEASEINNRGQIVGRYVDESPKLRSFMLDRGRLKRIDVPDRCDTAAFGLNDRGQILIARAGATDGTTCPPEGGAR